ncbi:hypothetical protein DH2020_031118 [Rehmannia glutinosa]|uniref:Uncharacterized protein n=1 Tax=Rehmannia glutinosa TaxID=99300 RepID=A0ABR0VJM4_REHGL
MSFPNLGLSLPWPERPNIPWSPGHTAPPSLEMLLLLRYGLPNLACGLRSDASGGGGFGYGFGEMDRGVDMREGEANLLPFDLLSLLDFIFISMPVMNPDLEVNGIKADLSMERRNAKEGDDIEAVERKVRFAEDLGIEESKVLSHREVQRKGVSVPQIQVQWLSTTSEFLSWEDLTFIRRKFPSFDPWGQGSQPPGGIAMNPDLEVNGIKADLSMERRSAKEGDDIEAVERKVRFAEDLGIEESKYGEELLDSG